MQPRKQAWNNEGVGASQQAIETNEDDNDMDNLWMKLRAYDATSSKTSSAIALKVKKPVDPSSPNQEED